MRERIGYDDDVERILGDILGPSFFSKELSSFYARPFYDDCSNSYMIERKPVDRACLIIEGNKDNMAPFLELLYKLSSPKESPADDPDVDIQPTGV